jgi:hypothetical protein
MKTFAFILAAVALVATTTIAGRWQADLPGGSYIVSTGQISSISTSEYIVDGAARVTELTVATTSSVTARFYYIETVVQNDRALAVVNRLQGKAEEIAGRAGQEPIWQKVVKNYPLTTHAHTVEYRLSSKDQIQKLFTSLNDTWRANTNANIKISE